MLVKFHIKYLIGWLLLGSICSSCQNKHGERNIVVGVSYQNLQNEFIINIQDAIRKRAKEDSIDLIELDAQGKSENQISQIENFIAADVDAIILNPCDKEGSAPAVDIAVRDKKPIIVINSAVTNLNKANAYVGSDDGEAGRIAAQYIIDLLNEKGAIAVMHGVNGHSAEVQRTEGIREVLKKYPEAKIVVEQTANWDRAQAMALMENWLASPRKIDAVIAQNDEMALGAYKAIEAAGRQKEVKIIGIDAISDALKSVAENKMSATVFQDAPGQGALAVDLAKKVVQKQPVNHLYYIPFKLVTRANLKEFLKH
ncbi:MAG TPA: sugar ABC transporter substrate-binding protein [Segetibacter sp.]|nr:sugar ABC transporter substrate-binding protein [Segetibacter sp.]